MFNKHNLYYITVYSTLEKEYKYTYLLSLNNPSKIGELNSLIGVFQPIAFHIYMCYENNVLNPIQPFLNYIETSIHVENRRILPFAHIPIVQFNR